MDVTYYQQKLFLAQVDKKDKIIGPVERQKAHQEGLLHRGFTMILVYNNQYLLQQRKHPVFDKYWDFTFSSHQLYKDGEPEEDFDAIYKALKREWNLTKTDLKTTPTFLGKIYYLASDPKSLYTEHEFDYIYLARLKKLPQPNLDFSYGFKVVAKISEIKKLSKSYLLAPWVTQIIKKGLITKIASI